MSKDVIELLLVEDSEFEIELTLRALQEEQVSCKIHVARDGEEALKYLASCEAKTGSSGGRMPNVVLLDLKLPKIDGHEVLRQTKNNPATKIVPVVVLTSSKEHEDIVKSYLAGANSYIQKPVNSEKFRKVVKELGLYWLAVNELPSPELNG